MKLKYIITSLVAAVTLAVACEPEEETVLKEIQLESSFVSFPAQGGDVAFKFTTTDAWEWKNLPDWISSSKMTGDAGENTVTLTATAATETRAATINILCAGKTQNVNVIQMTEKVERQITPMADVIAAGTGTFRVKGTVTKITSTSYGNWYFNDGTVGADVNGGMGIQVYGTLNKKGNTYDKTNAAMENLNCPANPDAWEFSVGDILTVEGPLTLYNTTWELVDVTVISIERSLIKVKATELLGGEEPVATTEFPLDGGDIKVSLEVKGNGFHVSIPEAAKSWLHIDDFGSDYVTLKADANAGGDRSAEVTFSTEKDGVTYTCVETFTQKGAILEVSIADFLAAPVGDTQYRITGIITEVAKVDYGNVYIRDWSGTTYVYGIGAKYEFKDAGLAAGDIVTLVGKRGEHNGSAQMTGGQLEKSFITVKDKTLAEIAAAADDANVYYLATGTVKEIKNATYGNLYLEDASGSLYVYGCYPGWGASGDNRKNFLATAGINVGDKLTVFGVKGTHNSEAQINGGMYFSHEAAPAGPTFAIDGNFDDWEDVTTVFAGINDRILEWRAASDANNLYFYYKITAAKIKADGSSKIYIGFDLDNDATTGDQSEHGGSGPDNGSEALAFFYPWDGTTAVISGEDPASWVKCPTSAESSGKVTVGGKIEGDYAYLEISIPKSAFGTSLGSSFTVRHAMQYYKTNREVVNL